MLLFEIFLKASRETTKSFEDYSSNKSTEFYIFSESHGFFSLWEFTLVYTVRLDIGHMKGDTSELI